MLFVPKFRTVPPVSGVFTAGTKRNLGGLANFKVPPIRNEPNPSYAKGSIERAKLQDALDKLKSKVPVQVPLTIGSQEISSNLNKSQGNPSDHASAVANYREASAEQVNEAIEKALKAKPEWENMSFTNRAAIFLRAAELVATKYRYDIMAATMLGQGKNIWQAEIDAAAETADFYRFNVHYASELYKQQNTMNDAGMWNRLEYRPLEGFVYAISPFNFTAIGANLIAAPAVMGNVVIWKPSDYAIYSGYLQKKILEEAGLPPNVIQFLPGNAKVVTDAVLENPKFSALHFTGSTEVFRDLYGQISDGVRVGRYDSYPRVVGETGGKNFGVVHGSADIRNAVVNTVRGAFEYQGQKCSATSRLYVAESAWPEFKTQLVSETEKLKTGGPEEFDNFIGPVIHERSWEKLNKVIEEAKKDPSVSLLAGGNTDRAKGWFVKPTIFQVEDRSHSLMKNEFFGPILSVYVFPDSKFEETLSQVDSCTKFGLTGAIFAKDRSAIEAAEKQLRHSAGNFYINCKTSGAVVGHQPFGGSRASGTNDKATSTNLVARFASIRSIKEDFQLANEVTYPSNEV